MARPRNKIASLPLDLRQTVVAGLINGRTYDQIRADLAAAGVAPGDLPHNTSFLAYRTSPEYKAEEQALREWKRRAEEKRQFWGAILTGGGAEGLANVATFEAIENLRDQLKACTNPAEAARIGGVIGTLARTIQAESEARWKRDLAEKAEKAVAVVDDAQTLSPEERKQRIREILGL